MLPRPDASPAHARGQSAARFPRANGERAKRSKSQGRSITTSAMNIALLKQLSEAPGVPGREERVREILKRHCDGVFDTVTTDAMGSLIATKRAAAKDAKRVLLACHIDEIGFYVKHVDDKGFVRIHNVGGFDTRNLLTRGVLVQSRG